MLPAGTQSSCLANLLNFGNSWFLKIFEFLFFKPVNETSKKQAHHSGPGRGWCCSQRLAMPQFLFDRHLLEPPAAFWTLIVWEALAQALVVPVLAVELSGIRPKSASDPASAPMTRLPLLDSIVALLRKDSRKGSNSLGSAMLLHKGIAYSLNFSLFFSQIYIKTFSAPDCVQISVKCVQCGAGQIPAKFTPRIILRNNIQSVFQYCQSGKDPMRCGAVPLWLY